MLLKIFQNVAKLLPPRLPEIIYTVMLRPKHLRRLAHKILLSVLPPTVEIDGVSLYLNPTDPVLSPALAFGIYENYEREIFGQFCQEGATVVDIGANIGLYTAIAAAKVCKTGKVISIEPHPESFRLLQMTVEVNALNQVRSFNVAAGDTSRIANLYLTDENKADSRIYDDSGQRSKVPTEMVDIDHLLAANGIDRVQLIKMDIQGAEALALRGMAATLARNPDIVLFMEFWPWGIEQTGESAATCLRELLSAGFKFKEIDEDRRRLVDVFDVEKLIARHDKRQYPGVNLRRSHANLICIKGALASDLPSCRAEGVLDERVEQARSLVESRVG